MRNGGAATKHECVFCRIVAGREAPAGDPPRLLARRGGVVVFAPPRPVVPGHVLVVPLVHVASAATDPWVTGPVFAAAAGWAAQIGGPFNLITSSGRAATQTVFHLHVHYVPRAEGDGLMVPWAATADQDQRDPHRCGQLRELGRLWWETRDGQQLVAPSQTRVGSALAVGLDELARDGVQRGELR